MKTSPQPSLIRILSMALLLIGCISGVHAEEAAHATDSEATVGQAASGAGHQIKETAVDIGHAARDAAVGLGRTVKDTALTVGRAAKGTAIDASHAVGSAARHVGDSVRTSSREAAPVSDGTAKATQP